MYYLQDLSKKALQEIDEDFGGGSKTEEEVEEENGANPVADPKKDN